MASVEQVLLRQLYNEVLSKVGDEEQLNMYTPCRPSSVV